MLMYETCFLMANEYMRMGKRRLISGHNIIPVSRLLVCKWDKPITLNSHTDVYIKNKSQFM